MQKTETKQRTEEKVEDEVPQQRDEETQAKLDEAENFLAEVDELLEEANVPNDDMAELNEFFADVDSDFFMPFCGC